MDEKPTTLQLIALEILSIFNINILVTRKRDAPNNVPHENPVANADAAQSRVRILPREISLHLIVLNACEYDGGPAGILSLSSILKLGCYYK